MEPKNISRSFVRVVFFCAITLQAGDKIQFSTPSRDDGLPAEQRSLPKTSPNLFDKYRGGGVDAWSVPTPVQQPSQGSDRTRENERKDWILARPDDRGTQPGATDGSKRTGEKMQAQGNGLDRYVQELEKSRDLEQEHQRLTERDKRQANEQEASEEQRKSGESSFDKSGYDSGKLNRETFTFKEFWKETTGIDSMRFDEQSAARRSEFQQIFETRGVAQEISTADDKNVSDRIAPAPTDYSSRTSQSSRTDSYQNSYSGVNGPRSGLFDNMNDRSLGRDPSSAMTRMEQPKMKVQPAVLPFPSRPGELFKRPGSF